MMIQLNVMAMLRTMDEKKYDINQKEGAQFSRGVLVFPQAVTGSGICCCFYGNARFFLKVNIEFDFGLRACEFDFGKEIGSDCIVFISVMV